MEIRFVTLIVTRYVGGDTLSKKQHVPKKGAKNMTGRVASE